MKKIIAVFCAVFSFAALAEESIYTLKNADFQQKFAFWTGTARQNLPPEKLGYAIETADGKNVLVAVGSDKIKSFQLVQHIDLKENELVKKHVTFGAMVKPEKLSGSFKIMIREVLKNKRWSRYRTIALNKYTPNEWKKFVSSFVVTSPTVSLQFYIQSSYLAPGDRVLVKEPFVTITAK